MPFCPGDRRCQPLPVISHFSHLPDFERFVNAIQRVQTAVVPGILVLVHARTCAIIVRQVELQAEIVSTPYRRPKAQSIAHHPGREYQHDAAECDHRKPREGAPLATPEQVRADDEDRAQYRKECGRKEHAQAPQQAIDDG